MEIVAGCKRFKVSERTTVGINCTRNPFAVEVEEVGRETYVFAVTLREYLTRGSGPYIMKPAKGTYQSPMLMRFNVLNSITAADSSQALEVKFVYSESAITLQWTKQAGGEAELEVEVNVRDADPLKYLNLVNNQTGGREIVVDFRTTFLESDGFAYSQNGLEQAEAPSPKFTVYPADTVDDYGLSKSRHVLTRPHLRCKLVSDTPEHEFRDARQRDR